MKEYTVYMDETFETARRPEECFDYTADFSLIKEWDHTVVESSKVSDGPVAEGTEFEVALKFFFRKVPMKYVITKYDYPNQVILEGEADSFRAVDIVSFKETEGGCEVTWKAKVTFRGMVAGIVQKFEDKVKEGGKKTVDGLKEALDDNYPVPQLPRRIEVADNLVLPGIWLFSKRGYKKARKRWNPVSASIKGKKIILTGGTSGIGLASAEYLTHRGADLTIVARNAEKAERVSKDLIRKTGNKNVAFEIADMSIMSEVVDLANRLLEKGQKIDVLINNAGALFNERKTTEEDLERSFALLLLGPFILTEKLIPLLDSAEKARVINVSSGGMYSQPLVVSDLENEKGNFDGSKAYARAKRALVVCTEQWADIYGANGTVFHAMHPGWADTPGVESSLPGFYKLTKRILRTPEEGADTINWLAIASEATKANGWFWLDREPHTTHLISRTRSGDKERDVLREKLMEYARKFDPEIN